MAERHCLLLSAFPRGLWFSDCTGDSTARVGRSALGSGSSGFGPEHLRDDVIGGGALGFALEIEDDPVP